MKRPVCGNLFKCFFMVWMFPAMLYGQFQTVFGTVVDKDSKIPLPGATIVLENTDFKAVTNIDGKFDIRNVPFARYDIKISYLGYETLTLSQIQVSAGKSLALNIELSEAVTELQQVQITGDNKDDPLNEMTTVSAKTFSVEETQRYSASFGDPSRMALSFAGVSTSNDASNEIIIRGNSSRGLLWRVEGVEIPNPNHFGNSDGSSGGAISMLSPQVLGTSDFLTGAFSAEYGNALSGVFDLRFRKGNYTKREYTFQLSGLGIQVSLEGPFSKKWDGSYLFNYRYSTIKLLDLMGLKLAGDQAPDYQDLSFNFSFPAGKAGVFTLFGVGGLNRAGAPLPNDSTQWENPGDRYFDGFTQYMGTAGITHTYLFSNKKTYLKTVASFSSDGSTFQADSLDDNYVPQPTYRRNYTYYYIRATSYVNHKFNSKHTLRAGVIYSHLLYDVFAEGINTATGNNEVFADEKGNSYMLQAYSIWKYRVGPSVDFVAGLHGLFFGLNNRWSLEPRAAVKWRINKRHSVNLGTGLHSRIDPISNYMANIQVDSVTFGQLNRNLDLNRSVHVVGGYDWVFWEDMRLKAEVYFQYLFNIGTGADSGSVFSMINESGGFNNLVLNNNGLGRNYGLELTVEKRFSKNYFFLFTASLYNSEYSTGDGTWRNTRFNGNYAFNVLGGYEYRFGKNKQHILGVNARVMYRGGNRYTPIDLNASIQQGREIANDSLAFEPRLQDFFRWDMSASLKFNFKKWAFTILIDVQNVINYQNLRRYRYDPYKKEIITDPMFGIIPMVNYIFQF